jgi:chemotaxis protein MotB
MAGKGGGAWKVAYADFVTAMMAFFMVMWLTSQNEAIKEAVAHHFEDPFSPYEPIDGATANKPKPGPTHNVPLPKRLEEKDKKRRTRKPTLLTLGDGRQTTTGTIVFFTAQSADLDQQGQTRLNDLLPSILGKPQKIEIRGHASRRPLPPDCPYKDAWQLSYARCLATMQYLQTHGIGAERMRLSQAGVYEPLGEADGPDKLAEQERVEVKLLNELARDSLTGADGAADRAPSNEDSSGNHRDPNHAEGQGANHAPEHSAAEAAGHGADK